ncbi:MAG: CrcB family protein [Muribaculaceae bacterium]|nr:CrcB family protein [Muribaculaceae bacterium]MDE6294831.1 CrcB family protein [Muribaculaceae bacterium]
MTELIKIAVVFGSGGFGAVCRYLIEMAMRHSMTGMATWVINSIGCFLIGIFAGWLVNTHCSWSANGKEFFLLASMTGFCGGFSTFSSFTLDCVHYFERGHLEIWLIFAVMTVFVGLFGCALGYWLGRHI